MHRLLLAPLVAAFALAPLHADWPQFRGPTGQGHADAKNPPTEWGPNQNVTWRTELPGSGWSSPVIAAGRVYLTAAVPQGDSLKVDQSLRALCLDAKSGAIVWDREVFRQNGTTAPRIHSKNSHASPTPVVAGDRVYVHFGHAGTACLNAKDGSPVWTNRDLKYNPVHGNGGSPALVGDKLVFSTDGTDRQEVVALNAATGKVAWKTPRNAKAAKGFSFSTPLVIRVNGREQVISQGTDVVMALDPATGKELWRVRYDGYSVVPRPVYADGVLYLSTGYDHPAVYAIRADGAGDVTDSHVLWKVKKDTMPRNASPLLVGDALYVVADNGVLTCLDTKTGKERWTARLPGAYSASLLLAAGRVYALAEDGTATVFKPGADYEEVARNKLGERALASMSFDGDALFLRTAKALYRIEQK